MVRMRTSTTPGASASVDPGRLGLRLSTAASSPPPPAPSFAVRSIASSGDVPGRHGTEVLGPHHTAHGVQGGAPAVDQDGDVGGRDVVSGDDGDCVRRRGVL